MLPVSNSKTQEVLVALVLGVALIFGVPPLRAANAANPSSALPPLARLYRLLGERPRAYYLVSPEIVTSAVDTHGDHDIDGRIRQLELGTGYIMVYGKNERLSGRALLARENMKTIRSHLVTSSVPISKAITVDSMGLLDIDSLALETSYACQLRFINRVSSTLVVANAGKKLSAAQSCIGFGVAAALAGYKIEAVKHGLEFRRVLDVKQGSAVQEDGLFGPPYFFRDSGRL